MKKVIDIVLLPDEKAKRICEDVNQNIWGKIDFIHTNKNPHISLLMWVMEESKLNKIKETLIDISKEYYPITLTWKLEKHIIPETGEVCHFYELDKNEHVGKLFWDISKQIKPQLEYNNITTNLFYQPEEVEEQSIVWVKWFEMKNIDTYNGHITLWIWDLKWENPSAIDFEAKKIAIYQLGNYCSCDNQLFELDLW